MKTSLNITTYNEMFERVYERVKQTDIWNSMVNVTENSPWHREESVARHTEMTLKAYEENFSYGSTGGNLGQALDLVTKMILLFHDFGKPEAEETLTRDDGTDYRRYSGHELISANEFMNFMMLHDDLRAQFFYLGFTWDTLRDIKFFIENHLPYDLQDKQKRFRLFTAVSNAFNRIAPGKRVGLTIFFNMLQSDSLGRISDDHAAKLQKVADWIDAFEEVGNQVQVLNHPDPTTAPTLAMMCGVSGAGKSTYRHALQANKPALNGKEWKVLSYDEMRFQYTNSLFEKESEENYLLWQASPEKVKYNLSYQIAETEEHKAASRALSDTLFRDLVKAKENIIVDNMNVGRKQRAAFVAMARAHGYYIETHEFWVTHDLVQARQRTRDDKKVPYHVVRRAYYSQQVPLLGYETDKPVIVPMV